jgi:hypothetical protein
MPPEQLGGAHTVEAEYFAHSLPSPHRPVEPQLAAPSSTQVLGHWSSVPQKTGPQALPAHRVESGSRQPEDELQPLEAGVEPPALVAGELDALDAPPAPTVSPGAEHAATMQSTVASDPATRIE